ncbi:hypothetical protein HN018_00740 [Lichenicola cladoniae]|uniref:Uncharacterized protein n=1 Tax=Lichenicola cladoniae TaxID=1484109 RepID=A0A6M8H599_9PROT|nr:hypothetical protein [Lichenicola cladoniae]NPD65170.1 hypothetical protein [Acetobacteraceae bacterium]QKE88771.1 hypothetical protein HN018_00740 [Lichenicola cladoniae]
MSFLRRSVREIWELFADGSITPFLMIAWIAAACFGLRYLALGVWSGPILFMGVAAITCVGAWRQR